MLGFTFDKVSLYPHLYPRSVPGTPTNEGVSWLKQWWPNPWNNLSHLGQSQVVIALPVNVFVVHLIDGLGVLI